MKDLIFICCDRRVVVIDAWQSNIRSKLMRREDESINEVGNNIMDKNFKLG